MNLPLRQHKARTNIPKRRTKPRRQKAIKCRPHINWVLDNFRCLLAGKVSKRTGKPHECWGPLDPHHSPTRGAGGGDNNVSPTCRGAHSLLDSPGNSQVSVEEEYGVSFRETGDSLWLISPEGKRYRLKQAQAGPAQRHLDP